MKHTIDLAYKTTSFFHVSAVEQGCYASPDDDGIGYTKKSGMHFPITRTRRSAVVLPMDGAEDGASFGPTVPVLPANGHRGRLRRAAASVLFELLAARGEKLSLDAYHVAMCGAPSGIPDGETMKISEAFAAMSHPYVGIFGGGRRFTRSCLSVGEGWPVHPLTLAAGLIPDSMREQAVAHKKRGQANYDTNWLTHNLFSTKKDDVLTFTNGMMNVIEDAEAAVSAWNARLGESRDRKKAAEKAAKDGTDAEADNGKKISLAGVHAHEVVLPGVTFHSRLLVDDSLVNAAGLGLLIHSIIRFANTGQHGGRKQVGMGRFNLASATINGAALVALAPDGTVEPCVDTEIVGKACDAWAAYATTVTAANLTAVLLT